jgi:cyclopentanol dehydrogenase
MIGGGLRDKIALVPSGASGLGQACAIPLADEGAALRITDLDIQGAAETVETIVATGGVADAVRADAADVAQTGAAVSNLLAQHGRLGITINNAGIITPFRLAGDITDEDWDRQIAINLSGVGHAMRFELAAMVAQGGLRRWPTPPCGSRPSVPRS